MESVMGEHPARIMVVDDESVVRANLSAFLEDEGFIVISAPDGEQALSMLSEEGVDLCIVDMRLPGMDGNNVIHDIHTRWPNTRFLIHTGSADYRLPPSLIDIGVCDAQVMMKPIKDMATVVKAVKHALSATQAAQSPKSAG